MVLAGVARVVSREVIMDGIEIELKFYIDKIRQAFPNARIFTERCVQDCPDEMWYIEEDHVRVEREQPDTFVETTTYSVYFSPDITDIAKIQSRIREIRRWQEIQLLWYPFVKDLVFETNDDTLRTSFSLWRRYRVIPKPGVKMGSCDASVTILQQ